MAEEYKEENAEEYSPFGAEEAPGISLIVLMRIYDVLMAQYTQTNPAGAAELMNIHAQGGLIGSLPFFDPSLVKLEEDSPDSTPES